MAPSPDLPRVLAVGEVARGCMVLSFEQSWTKALLAQLCVCCNTDNLQKQLKNMNYLGIEARKCTL